MIVSHCSVNSTIRSGEGESRSDNGIIRSGERESRSDNSIIRSDERESRSDNGIIRSDKRESRSVNSIIHDLLLKIFLSVKPSQSICRWIIFFCIAIQAY